MPRPSWLARRWLPALLAGLASVTAWAAGEGIAIEEMTVEQPRTFGFQLGDMFERKLTLRLRRPYALVTDSLPGPGRLNRWVAFHSHDLKTRSGPGADDIELTLRYQIVNVEPGVTDAGVPSHKLQIAGNDETLTFQVPPSRTVITPFSEAASAALAPDIAPARLTADYGVPVLFGTLCLTSLAALSWLQLGGFGGRANRPFREAYRHLRGLKDEALSEEAYAGALRQIHEAFNVTAGHTLFPEQLTGFIEQYPAFAAMRDDIADYFLQSNAYFFGDCTTRRPLSELVSFARRCRDIEQDLA